MKKDDASQLDELPLSEHGLNDDRREKIHPAKEPADPKFIFWFTICCLVGVYLLLAAVFSMLANYVPDLSAIWGFTFAVLCIMAVCFLLPVIIYRAKKDGVFED